MVRKSARTPERYAACLATLGVGVFGSFVIDRTMHPLRDRRNGHGHDNQTWFRTAP
jgi:hypothetical protein